MISNRENHAKCLRCLNSLEYLYTSNGYDQLYCHNCDIAVSRAGYDYLDPFLRLEEKYGE